MGEVIYLTVGGATCDTEPTRTIIDLDDVTARVRYIADWLVATGLLDPGEVEPVYTLLEVVGADDEG